MARTLLSSNQKVNTRTYRSNVAAIVILALNKPRAMSYAFTDADIRAKRSVRHFGLKTVVRCRSNERPQWAANDGLPAAFIIGCCTALGRSEPNSDMPILRCGSLLRTLDQTRFIAVAERGTIDRSANVATSSPTILSLCIRATRPGVRGGLGS